MNEKTRKKFSQSLQRYKYIKKNIYNLKFMIEILSFIFYNFSVIAF